MRHHAMPATVSVLVLTCALTVRAQLRNGDFSETADDRPALPAAWTVPENAGGAWKRVDDDGPTGNFCLRFRENTGASVVPVTQTVTLTPRTDYQLQFASKSDGTLAPLIRVVDAAGKRVLVKVSAPPLPSWRTHTVTFTNGDGDRATIEIHADAGQLSRGETPAGTAWFGAFRLGKPSSQAAADARRRIGVNVALGKPVTLDPKPRYSYCSDPDDPRQITDGVYTTGYFWTQKTTVGWSGLGPKTITIDLQAVEPIRGVSFSTAAGVAGVTWPGQILVFVSDNGETWYSAGDLVTLSAKNARPPADQYSTHLYWTDALATRGRYVKLVVEPGGDYVFVDEIEVFRGDEALLAKAHPGPGRPSVEDFLAEQRFNNLIKAQLRRDLYAATDDLAAVPADAPGRAALVKHGDALAEDIQTLDPISPEGFRAVLPMVPLEEDIFGFQADVWRMQGKPELRIWQCHRWDPLAPAEEPQDNASTPHVNIAMMMGEVRADVLNLTSAGNRQTRLRLRIEGLPGGTNPDWLAVHEVLHVGTRRFVSVAAALPRARRIDDAYILDLHPGMTSQIWFSVHSENLTPGAHDGSLVLESPGTKYTIPIRIRVYADRFPEKQSLLLGGWSYTDAESMYGVTPTNRQALIDHLREHGVNAPWATRASLPAGTFDEQGGMTTRPDTTRFDTWVALWPDAERYLVFAAVQDSFGGSAIGTPLFNAKVGSWVRFWADHMTELGLRPDQLGLLLVDEPHGKPQYDTIVGWARAINTAAPEVILWEDPQIKEPETCLEMFEAVDVLVPYRAQWLMRPDWFREIFIAQRNAGKDLGFYSADGPARCFDPFSYYLVQQWHIFKIGGRWSGFWAFGDTGRVSVWNEYATDGRGPYTPLYLDDTGVTAAKYMEAIREGVDDFEVLTMLKKRVENPPPDTAPDEVASARKLLESACDRVLEAETGRNYFWNEPKNRAVADTVRVEILEALQKLKPNAKP